MTHPLKNHWNQIYSLTPITQLGWYEADASPSLGMIARCDASRQASILDIGSGASTLVPHLLKYGYEQITAVDISEVALEKAKAQLTPTQREQVRWLAADITDPGIALLLPKADIWHDRALFHFLTAEQARQAYLAALHATLRPGGSLILAAFALDGAEKCSGLAVRRYSVDSLSITVGPGFRLVDSLDYTYRMPSGGLRPYVYARFQKILE